MKPRGVASRWVKLRPWYYTERRQPARAAELRHALSVEAKAEAPLPDDTPALLALLRILKAGDLI